MFHVFGMGEFTTPNGPDGKPREDIDYRQSEDEMAMIECFLQYWEDNYPDIVTGWNIKIFDIPYLVNRITRVLGEKDAKRLSPWKMIREKTETLFHRDVFVYEVAGVGIIDYMAIYRKNVQEPRESYSLNNIATVELGEQKISYSEVESLHSLYRTNHQKFLLYNIHDVELVDRLDAKLKLIELQLVVAYDSHVNYEDVFSQVRVWDTGIHNHLLKKGVVIPQKVPQEKASSYAGAYVMEPVVGLHNWVVSFDVTSLYPTIMMLLNIGNESKIDKRTLTPAQRDWLASFSSRAEGGDPRGPEILLSGGTDLEMLHSMDATLSANGVLYRREPTSFYSEMITHLFNKRVAYKKRAQNGKKKLELIHALQKQRKEAAV
jgi:DNA polymerase elongation subunit (family B)